MATTPSISGLSHTFNPTHVHSASGKSHSDVQYCHGPLYILYVTSFTVLKTVRVRAMAGTTQARCLL